MKLCQVLTFLEIYPFCGTSLFFDIRLTQCYLPDKFAKINDLPESYKKPLQNRVPLLIRKISLMIDIIASLYRILPESMWIIGDSLFSGSYPVAYLTRFSHRKSDRRIYIM